jgi:signal transduction histidine kinase
LKSLLNKKNIYSEADQQWFVNKLLPMVMLLLLPVLTLICLNDAIEIFVEMGTISQYWSIFNTIDVFLVFILSSTTLYAAIRLYKSLENDFASKVAYRHVQFLEEMLNGIRKQRHDFNNHLSTVYGLMLVDEFDRAKAYITKTVEEVQSQNDLLKTDNPFISSLLYTKMSLAETQQIKIEASIMGSLKDLPVNNHELTSVLGNLLDNAIAAVNENNELTDRHILVNIERNRELLMVTVTNHGNIPSEIVSRIFEPNFSTKGSCGLGLPITKEITERHGGKLDLLVENNNIIFSSSIPLPA